MTERNVKIGNYADYNNDSDNIITTVVIIISDEQISIIKKVFIN